METTPSTNEAPQPDTADENGGAVSSPTGESVTFGSLEGDLLTLNSDGELENLINEEDAPPGLLNYDALPEAK